MKKIILVTLSLFVMLSAGGEYAYANGNKQPQQSSKSSNQSSKSSKSSIPSSYKGKPVTVVKSSKPKTVNKLPATKYPVKHNGSQYYNNKSKYYKYSNGKYIWTPPPFGLRVSIIPAIHSIFRFNNINYYCSEGVIYQQASNNEYVVVEPQMGMVVPELPMVNVNQVSIDGNIYFEFDGILYKQIPTVSGIQYEVIGSLYD